MGVLASHLFRWLVWVSTESRFDLFKPPGTPTGTPVTSPEKLTRAITSVVGIPMRVRSIPPTPRSVYHRGHFPQSVSTTAMDFRASLLNTPTKGKTGGGVDPASSTQHVSGVRSLEFSIASASIVSF